MATLRIRTASTFRTILMLAAGLIVFEGCQKVPPPPPNAPKPAHSASTPAASTPAPASPATLPFVKKHIYSETANPRADIAAALKQAQVEHKRVILDFGGDWCGDCQVLDIYFRQAPNDELLKNFVVAHIFIDSQIDNNLDLGMKYGIPLKKGVPALAILDAHGKVLYSQKTGEFENMRHMDVQSVTDFLNRWKS